MGRTKIEWTEKTWNPVTGCTKVSQGCKHCYAEVMHERFNMPGSFKNVTCHEDRLTIPIKWKKPSLIFVCSMADLFHESVPFEFIDEVFYVMAGCAQHTFQVLTKRPERMRQYFMHVAEMFDQISLEFGPLSNVWIGVSVEDQKAADERIPILLQVPAAVRWLSCEPLLGEVNILKRLSGIDWIVVGGESGHGARRMDPDWVRQVHGQCVMTNTPFFFKQWGEYDEAELVAEIQGLARLIESYEEDINDMLCKLMDNHNERERIREEGIVEMGMLEKGMQLELEQLRLF